MTSYCCFYEATGIAVEYDNVAYICDPSVGFIKIITELKETAKFLGGLQSIINVCLIKVLLWGLNKLKENHESFSYNKVNLLSCMTLSAENLHSAVNRKQDTQTLVSYAQGFVSAIKESIKVVAKLPLVKKMMKGTWTVG